MAVSRMIVVALGGATFHLVKPWVTDERSGTRDLYDQLGPPRSADHIDVSDHDRRAIEGTLEGLGYL